MQFYFDPARASDPHALPDIEIWESAVWTVECQRPDCGATSSADGNTIEAQRPECYCPACGYNSGIGTADGQIAFWYWYCLPGCLPDSDPSGPFLTEHGALSDARAR